MKNIIFIGVIIASLFSLVLNENALAWDNEVTHRDISEIAANNSVLSTSKGNYLKNLGLANGLMQPLIWGAKNLLIKKWLAEGAYLEDAGSNLQGFLGLARYNNHFHNPLKPWGGAGLNDLGYTGESTIFWAQYGSWQASYLEGDQSWEKIRSHFYNALTSKTDSERQAYFSQTFKGLGHQMHLIQDMAVPAHVRNDAHPLDSVVGSNPLTGDYYFEKWAKRYYVLINAFAQSPAFPSVDLNTSRSGLAPISQLIDSEQYDINISPSNSLAWGLSEYTSSNFLSNDTIFTESLNSDNGHYFPYPRYLDLNQCYEQFDLSYDTNQKRTYWRKRCAGEPINHFVAVGPLFKYLPTWALQRKTLKLDAQTHYDYAEKLVPRAVGYSAGLLNYFFRGDIDMMCDDAGGSGYLIVNNTDEDMNGTFELWYDNKNDERNMAWSGSFSIAKKSSGNNKSTDIVFTAPADAKEPDKYMLVFKGKMGSEENAVAGKTIELKGITGRLVQVDRSVNGEMLLLRVYTGSGLIFADFNISNWGIIGVRFNLNNDDEFIVAVSSNEFHKFTVDAPKKTITYNGIVAGYPSSTIDTVAEYCEFVDGSPDDCVYYDGMPGPFRAIDGLRSYTGDYVTIQDFYYDSGSIKPFGEHHEDTAIFSMYADYCGEREMFRESDPYNIFISERKNGIYYGSKLTNVSYADCIDGKLPQSCADYEGTRCSYLKSGIDMVDMHSPLAILAHQAFSWIAPSYCGHGCSEA